MMKKRVIFSMIVLLPFLILSFSCKKKSEKGDIQVSCKPLAGETVDVSSLTVEIHSRAQFDAKITSAQAAGSATLSTASFSNLDPGRYYVMAWKDIDNSSTVTENDYFGFYPFPINLNKGNSKNIQIELYIVD
mgnify:CR=1 FL=1